MNKQSTGYFDQLNREVFVGDRFYSNIWNRMFTVDSIFVSTQNRTQYFLISDDKRINLGMTAVSEMNPEQ